MELYSECTAKDAAKEEVIEAVKKFINEGDHLSSIKTLREFLKDEHDIEVKPWKLREYLKKDLGMRFKKI